MSETAEIIYEHHTGDQTSVLISYNGEKVPLPVGRAIEVPAGVAEKWTAWPAPGGIYGVRYVGEPRPWEDEDGKTDIARVTVFQKTGQTVRDWHTEQAAKAAAAAKAERERELAGPPLFPYGRLAGAADKQEAERKAAQAAAPAPKEIPAPVAPPTE